MLRRIVTIMLVLAGLAISVLPGCVEIKRDDEGRTEVQPGQVQVQTDG